MFGTLVEAVDGLAIPLEREALAEAIAVRDRLCAKVAAAVGAYAAGGYHELDGSTTMAAWLGHHAALDPVGSRVEARRAAKLHALPVLRAAFEAGEVSAGAVEVILAKLPNRHLGRFAAHEADLVPALAELDIEALGRAMVDWRARADALDPGPAPAERPDTVHLSPTLTDRGVLNGSLGADLFNLLATALRLAEPKDLDQPAAQRRAAALGQICQTFLDLQHRFRGGRRRPNAIAARDGGCRFPGCGAPASWCDIHHVEPWEHGGSTDIDNGIMLCRRHHTLLHHKPGWKLKLLPDATVELTHPTGRTEQAHPRGLHTPRLPLTA